MNIGILDKNNTPIKINDVVEVDDWMQKTFTTTIKIEMITVTGDDYNYVDVIGIEGSDRWQFENTPNGLKATNVKIIS